MRACVTGHVPAEFERQAAMVLGFHELVRHFPQLMVDVVRALIGRVPLIGIVHSEEQRRYAVTLLCDWGLPAHQMHFVCMPLKGMWVRDYGPAFVRLHTGDVAILDPLYAQAERQNDDMLPTALADLLKLPVAQVPLAAEGGNLLTNGRGFVITTEVIMSRNAKIGHTPQQVRQILHQYYGFTSGVSCFALANEPNGHADMFATFVSADTVVIGQYDPAQDSANAGILDRNATKLAQTTLHDGGLLKVVRIPMPSNKDRVFRTYTNVIYANGTLLVPSYADVDQGLEREAHAIYRALLPDWDLIAVDCTEVIKYRGALHCMSIGIPWLYDRFDVPTEHCSDEMPLEMGPLGSRA